MSVLKRIVPLIVLLVFAHPALAQNVTNVDANQEGKSIAVTYSLKQKASISLFMTQDGGKTRTAIPQKFTSGDVGKNVAPGDGKKILWHVLEQYPEGGFRGENISFIVKDKEVMQFFTMLNGGYTSDSGMNVGISVGQLGVLGWYVKAMTTLSLPKTFEYQCDEKGYVGGVLPAYSGSSNKFKAVGIAGLTARIAAPIYLNVGVGYGTRKADWELADGRWVNNTSLSYSGVAFDAGVIGKLNGFLVSVGATYILGGSFDVSLGLGYAF